MALANQFEDIFGLLHGEFPETKVVDDQQIRMEVGTQAASPGAIGVTACEVGEQAVSAHVEYLVPLAAGAVPDGLDEMAFTDDERSVDLARASEEERVEHDREWVKRLGQRWRTHHGQDLALRHETGKIVNDRFGPPTARLPRGEGVMKLLAEETGLNQTAISRMRWFTHRFPAFEAFTSAHPDVRSWEKVCLLLVELSRKDKEAAVASTDSSKGKNPSKAASSKIFRSLKAVVKSLPKEAGKVDEDDAEDIQAELNKFRRALRKCTGLNVTISIAPATDSVAS